MIYLLICGIYIFIMLAWVTWHCPGGGGWHYTKVSNHDMQINIGLFLMSRELGEPLGRLGLIKISKGLTLKLRARLQLCGCHLPKDVQDECLCMYHVHLLDVCMY
jgi:hypothetical protein